MRISYEDGRRIAQKYGCEEYGEPLKEYRIIQNPPYRDQGGLLEETETSCSLISVRKNGKVGLIDANNNIVVPFEYDDLFLICYNGILILRKKGKYGGLYRHNLRSVAFNFQYEYLGCIYNMSFNACLNGKWGLVKPGDVRLTDFKYIGFYRNDGGRYTTYTRVNFWGNKVEGKIDLETGREI